MEEKDVNDILKEEPIGNLEISLGQIASFEGNKDINGVESLVDEAFKSFLTISIEGQEKKYRKEERQALLDEIYKLLKKGESNETQN